MKEKWLNDLQARIQKEYHVSAPEGLLDDIKLEMQRRGITPKQSGRQKARIVPLWLYSSISIAAMVVIGLYLFDVSTKQSLFPNQAITMLDHKATTTSNLTIEETNIRNSSSSNTINSGHSASKNVESSVKEQPNNGSEIHLNKQSLLANNTTDHTEKGNIEENKTSGNQQETVYDTSEKNTTQPQNIDQQPRERRITNYYPQPKHNIPSSRLTIGTSYSGTIGSSLTSQAPLLAAANPYGEYTPEFSGANIQRYLNEAEKAKVHAKHRPAVKFGVSVRYNLNERWSLQSGLTYSKLSSNFKHKIADDNFDIEQNLHYVGLPIHVSYSLLRAKRFNVYTTVGGEIEKLIKGKSTRKSKHDSKISQSYSSITENQPVFSMNAAMGGEYFLNEKVSAYVEPGASYYFKNGSNVENVYKDKPTNFNLNIGLRVALNK